MNLQNKPPRRVIIGKRTRGKLTDLDVLFDFFEAFCHAAVERCSPSISDWPISRFGPIYEFKKCPDFDFQQHVSDSCQLARQYLAAKRLYGFEVCMITPSETQLISFRICLSQLESAPQNEQVPNIYPRFTEVIESVRNLEIPESVNNEMSSTKYRPRIRLLTRLRSESSRKVDTSKPGEDEITIALGDSVFHSANIISFYAHM